MSLFGSKETLLFSRLAVERNTEIRHDIGTIAIFRLRHTAEGGLRLILIQISGCDQCREVSNHDVFGWVKGIEGNFFYLLIEL